MTISQIVSAITAKEIISKNHRADEEVLVNIGSPYGTVKVDAISDDTFVVMNGDKLYMKYGEGCHYHEVYHSKIKGDLYIL